MRIRVDCKALRSICYLSQIRRVKLGLYQRVSVHDVLHMTRTLSKLTVSKSPKHHTVMKDGTGKGTLVEGSFDSCNPCLLGPGAPLFERGRGMSGSTLDLLYRNPTPFSIQSDRRSQGCSNTHCACKGEPPRVNSGRSVVANLPRLPVSVCRDKSAARAEQGLGERSHQQGMDALQARVQRSSKRCWQCMHLSRIQQVKNRSVTRQDASRVGNKEYTPSACDRRSTMKIVCIGAALQTVDGSCLSPAFSQASPRLPYVLDSVVGFSLMQGPDMWEAQPWLCSH